jgi:hypothetical protein
VHGESVPAKESALSNPKRAFDLAFADACEAADFETAEIHLGHAMDELYRLYELAKKSPSKADKRARDQALIKIDKGEIAGAVVWARKYRIHDSMQVSHAAGALEVTQPADQYSNCYTNLYGVLAWRPRSDFTTGDDNGRGWHLFYDTHLEGRPVLDTLQQAAKALETLAARPTGPGRPPSGHGPIRGNGPLSPINRPVTA